MSNASAPTSLSTVTARLRAAGSVFAEDEAQLLVAEASSAALLADMVERRVAGLPLEHILGWVEFCGMRIQVDHGLFVPRRRTEFLARKAICIASPTDIVLDLCCGTGAIGVAIVEAADGVDLYAADTNPAAVRCARRNLAGRGRVFEGNLYDPLPDSLRSQIDIIVVNAPYVPTGAIAMMPPEARLHEARIALDGGADGLDIQRRVAESAFDWLAPRGQLLIETSEHQSDTTMQVLAAQGLEPDVVRSDELDATVVIARKP